MTIKECTAWLNEHDDILILTHVRPDGDTLGGAAALCSAMRRTGKNAALFNNPDITPKYFKYVKDFVSDNFDFACTLAVDVAEAHMLPTGFSGDVDVCIDHHPSNSHYAEKLLLDGSKASCGEIVLEVIKAALRQCDRTGGKPSVHGRIDRLRLLPLCKCNERNVCGRQARFCNTALRCRSLILIFSGRSHGRE